MHEIFVQALTAATVSDLLCTFHRHFIFVPKSSRAKYAKITCIRNILDLQYYETPILLFNVQ